MQSDTVIGIVGAVVLVAVMIGVFAYEYNNAEETPDDGPDPNSPEAREAAFNATFTALDPRGDIDGDGTLNYLDDDIDDDGLNNTVDTDVVVTFDLSQPAPAYTNPASNPPASAGLEFVIEEGYDGFEATVSHGGGPVQGQARVRADAGDAGSCTTNESLRCSFTSTGSVAADRYTLTLAQTVPNPNALPTTVTVTVTYPAPATAEEPDA